MLNELKTQKLVDAFRSDSSILETFFNSDVVAREKILLQLSTDHSLELSSSEINYIAKDPEDLISDLELTDSELELVSGGSFKSKIKDMQDDVNPPLPNISNPKK